MDGESNLGLNKLAQVMQARMDRNQDANNGALILDFGTIQPDMSLKTNTFAIPIPQTDYHVCRQLTHPQHSQPDMLQPRRERHRHHGRGHQRSAGPPYPVRADGGRRQP